MDKNIELLAPVGSMESLYAAVQNGANAVYLGGKLFNARQNASNFDREELDEAVRYAHLRGVKVYVTVNILIDNSEMEEVIDYIKFLYQIDIDGIIVQDLGLASLAREIFPDLEIHGSTQMTINSLEGAEFLHEMGFTRVVLARETPIEEIKYISNNTPIELEAFIHGALCISYSGQCLMSSMIGGRSGNRGTCAQPCRMPSSIIDKNGKVIEEWDKKHILSPRDLNTLENIKEILDAGVISLKIEGRMKRPEYVATVVKNYRKALDQGSENISYEDKRDLAQIFNRDFTKGLTFGDFGKEFMSFERPDNRGILAGKVVRADKYKVYVLLEEDINAGDGLEFELVNGEYIGIKAPFDGKKGTTMNIEKPAYILTDTPVRKTSSLELLSKAKASYNEENIKNPIDMEIDIKIGTNPKLNIIYKGDTVSAEADKVVEKAERAGLTKEKIVEQLSKLGDTTYILNNININLDDDSYLPVSVLNLLRREATEKLDQIVANINHGKTIDIENYAEKKKKYFKYTNVKEELPKKITIKVNNIDQFNQLDLNKLDTIYLGFYDNLEEVVNKVREKGKETYIWTDKILYKKDLDRLNSIIKPIEGIIDGISVSNLGSLKYTKDRFDLKIHGDIGLNVFNSFTLDYLNHIGLDCITLSPELNLNQIRKIEERSNVTTEAIVYGYLPVMTTKYCPMSLVKGCKDDSNCKNCNFAKGYGIKDRIGANFYMDRREGFSYIYNSVPLMVLDNLDQIYNSGISNGRLDFTIETNNIKDIQTAYYDYGKGLIDNQEAREYIETFRENKSITNGHYFRGIM